MNINDSKITLLRAQVKAAVQEFDMAVTFHEVWKPAAYDVGLHSRMGVSYATNAFHVVRLALRREMLLALIRLWDKDCRAVRMQSIVETLRNKCVIDSLAANRGIPPSLEGEVRQSLSQSADEAIKLVMKYSKGGSDCAVLEKLRKLRNERLAHRITETAGTEPTRADATDDEIESFYQDNSKLISLLLGLVEAVAYDPEDTAQVYRHYARHFWVGVRGEKTEGHPNYRAPIK